MRSAIALHFGPAPRPFGVQRRTEIVITGWATQMSTIASMQTRRNVSWHCWPKQARPLGHSTLQSVSSVYCCPSHGQ